MVLVSGATAMIHYMPFTYLSDLLIGRLASAVGSFSVCQTVEALLPAGMGTWIEKGVVQSIYADGLDSGRLTGAIDAFNQWGRIHEGRLAAMAGMYRSDHNNHSHADEHAPTRLSYLIRQYENQPDDRPDLLFRAALFLAMAQIHDEQQDTVSGTLAGVQRMEMEMASQLTGDADPLPEPFSEAASHGAPTAWDRGLQLTGQRIAAWAALASRAEVAPHLYLTTSPAVFAALMERLPDAVRVGEWHLPLNRLDSQSAVIPGKGPLDAAVETMATTTDPLNLLMDLGAGDQNGDSPALMTLAILPGSKPHEVLEALARGEGTGSKPHEVLEALVQGDVPLRMMTGKVRNTLFAHLMIRD
jgi:hypothetical protein